MTRDSAGRRVETWQACFLQLIHQAAYNVQDDRFVAG
jgi:hypothetical protein